MKKRKAIKKYFKCWVCLKIIKEDISRCGSAVNFPIWYGSIGNGGFCQITLPEPAHKKCMRFIIGKVVEAMREKRNA